jgi:hypothetical protein
MNVDPRLTSTELLALAAFRVHQRRQAARTQPPDWRYTEGLASLLEAARALPQRGPWDLPSVEESGGLAGLLADARRRDQEDRHGT